MYLVLFKLIGAVRFCVSVTNSYASKNFLFLLFLLFRPLWRTVPSASSCSCLHPLLRFYVGFRVFEFNYLMGIIGANFRMLYWSIFLSFRVVIYVYLHLICVQRGCFSNCVGVATTVVISWIAGSWLLVSSHACEIAYENLSLYNICCILSYASIRSRGQNQIVTRVIKWVVFYVFILCMVWSTTYCKKKVLFLFIRDLMYIFK